jgi:hypothetical protein
MIILAERIIAILKANSALVAVLGSNANIFPEKCGIKKDKYIVVETAVGEDGNNIPVDKGDLFVEVVVRRNVANAETVCLDLAKSVDDILNKGEVILSNSTYQILNFVRGDSSGLEIDEEAQEFYYRLQYNYLVCNE